LENISYDIEVQIADEQATTIVIYSVPIELPDSELRKALAPYGEVLKITNGCYNQPHVFLVYNEKKYVKLKRNNVELPATMNICGIHVQLSYNGMIRKCFFCSEIGHSAASCEKKQLYLQSKQQPDKSPTFQLNYQSFPILANLRPSRPSAGVIPPPTTPSFSPLQATASASPQSGTSVAAKFNSVDPGTIVSLSSPKEDVATSSVTLPASEVSDPTHVVTDSPSGDVMECDNSYSDKLKSPKPPSQPIHSPDKNKLQDFSKKRLRGLESLQQIDATIQPINPQKQKKQDGEHLISANPRTNSNLHFTRSQSFEDT
jgi:hypothetical protein